MNILVVTNMYPSDNDVSWRGSFVKEQVDECQKIGKEKFIFDVLHIKARVCGGSNINYLWAFFKIFFKVLFGSYHFVHCHHAFCVLLCFPFQRKVIYTVHEGELNHAKTSPLIKLAIKLSARVIYVNKTAFNNATKINKYFLPCGIDFNTFKPVNTSESNYILFPADPKRKEKRAEILQQIEQEIIDKYPHIHIEYGGEIPREQMPVIMGNALMVITIGDYESDGLVLKEAMALNVPVISTDVGNAAYYLNKNSGLIIESNTCSCRTAIFTILANRSTYLFGRDRLFSLHVDNTTTAKKVLSIYES